ncbi:hypothetical protein AVEN_144822-1 [Araneus ventricosus]|uniref:Uncharacterized protein n=1 Tax=Araneus ventricosus TaxID=182803 RepID=A0A4Y2T457_ARAVE|nr:hypothetical protein AVEN_144822-1 [Araneus ventricosus]
MTHGRPTPWHPLLVSPSFIHFAGILTTADHEQPANRAVLVILVPSLRAITICPLSNSLRSAAFPITRKSKFKNVYLPSPAAVKYHSHLTTCPPRHSEEFIEKCGDGHTVLARQCILMALKFRQSWVCFRSLPSKLFRLSDEATVFIAEVVTIRQAVKYIIGRPPKHAKIIADSRSALMSLA